MTWRRFKKYMREHPYNLDPLCNMKQSEVKKVCREEDIPDFIDILEGAKRKAPELEWPDFSRFDKKKRRRTAISISLKPLRSKIAIVCAVVLLVFAFITFTPPGRALADACKTFVSKIIDNVRYYWDSDVELESPLTVQEQANDISEVRTYSSIEQLVLETGKRPVILAHPSYRLDHIEVDASAESGFAINSLYVHHSDDVRVRFVQIMEPSKEMREGLFIAFNEDPYIQLVILEDIVADCWIASDDIVTCIAFVGDTVFEVFIEKSEHAQTILYALEFP